MAITSKDLTILLIGGIIATAITFFSFIFPTLKEIKLENFWTVYAILISLFMVLLIFLLIAQKRINENADEIKENKRKLEDINEKIRKVDERFKTIEELNDIRLNIKELQQKIFNGKKK